MRIIGGEWRGRKITAPDGAHTRPTKDRVREALFSMLTSRLGSFEDLRIADLFAGSGALGLEALSRGSAHCTFVEQDRRALGALAENIATLNAHATIQTRSVETITQSDEPYDLVFLDPPYGKGLAENMLPILLERNWIAEGSWISLETEPGLTLGPDQFELETTKRFGKSQLHLLKVASNNQ